MHSESSFKDGKMVSVKSEIFDPTKMDPHTKTSHPRNKIGSSMMVMDDISARGDLHSRRVIEGSSSVISEETEDQNQANIKNSSECEMFQNVKLGKKLGEGAYGQVFQALNKKNHRLIVVKKIPVAEHIACQKSKKSKDALNEIHMLTNLNHPNIVKYHDSCLHLENDTPQIHIYMEYMNQGSIK